MIEFKSVSKAFGGRQVLSELSFSVEKGEIVFLLGRSGVGKSVTLKHLVGLLQPDSGEIWVDGVEISRLSEREYFPLRKKCGMVFQFPALLDSLTVYENVSFGMRAHGLCSADDEPGRVREKLGLVGLGDKIWNQFPGQLSYGTQKRVALARTLALDPEYVLFDEPTTSLDPISTAAIHDLIRDLARRLGVSALVVSHDMTSAMRIADRILVLEGGRLVDQGSPAELKSSTLPLTQDFLRG